MEEMECENRVNEEDSEIITILVMSGISDQVEFHGEGFQVGIGLP